MKNPIAKIVAIAACGVLLVLFLLLPRLPESSREKIKVADSPLDQKVEQASAMVSSGSNPMEGIMLLREVLEEDSTHEKALLQMGYFSLQSRQLDKAKQRFEQVVRYHPENKHGWWELAHLNIMDEAFEKAEFQFEQVDRLDEDNTYTGVHFFLGKTYATTGKLDKALKQFEAYLPYAEDSVIKSRVEDFIVELRDK